MLNKMSSASRWQAENEKKELYLEKFAEGFDEIRSSLSLEGSLLAEMQTQRQATALELTKLVTQQLEAQQLSGLQHLALLCRIARRLPEPAASKELARGFLEGLGRAPPAQAKEALQQEAAWKTLQAAGVEVEEVKKQLLERVACQKRDAM